jgi:methionyl-tRNA formyltransferase
MANSSNFPNSLPSIVFFGNERLATGVTTEAPVLRALIAAGYPIEAIIVNNDQATSRKQRPLEIAELAVEHNIPLLTEFNTSLTSSIAVLVAYGRIVPQRVIDHFRYGIVNVHPSKLPLYRGSTPLESVILDGSTSTAVSLMQLSAKMDAGAVFAQRDLELPAIITKQELADAAGQLGAEMIVEALPTILAGSLRPQPQDESKATFTKQISKPDGQLDWNKPAQQLECEIRAYAGWPGSTTNIHGKVVTITAAEIIPEAGTPSTFFMHNKQLAVYCQQDALLIVELKPAGKRIMSGRDFLAGNPIST